MDYSLHYNRLIERGRGRNLSCYVEKHHIIPKCLGGDNSSKNIVRLTPEEHYVAHQLLVKIHTRNMLLLWAAVTMTAGNVKQKRNNKLYGWLRRRWSDERTGSKMSDEARRKMSENHNPKSNANRKRHSAKTKKKMSLSAKGIPKSIEHRKALSKARKGRIFGSVSEERRKQIQETNRRNALTRDYSVYSNPDYRKKQSDTMKEIWCKRHLGELSMPKSVKFINPIGGV